MAVGFPTKVNYATGDVLSATNMNDLSGTVNLLQSAQFAAGKNKLINGDCNINQRSFTSTTTTGTFGFDRFKLESSGGTSTYSAQTFTAGTAPVSGYESRNFMRLVTSGQSAVGDFSGISQPVEDVRTFAGQTVTFSVWAKASTGTPNIGFNVEQAFGTGGSATVPTSAAVQAITTSWARYSFTINVPSIAGKTIGTGAPQLNTRVFTSAGTSISAAGYPAVGIQNVTIDLWGWQLEAASTASPFQTATGTIQGELAACQRYFQTSGNQFGQMYSTTAARIIWPVQVQMRTTPTITYPTGAFTNFIEQVGIGNLTPTTLATTSTDGNFIYANATGMTAGTNFNPIRYNGTALQASAEL